MTPRRLLLYLLVASAGLLSGCVVGACLSRAELRARPDLTVRVKVLR